MHLFLHLISYFKTGSCACWRLCLRIERLELKVPRVRCANVHVSCQMFSSNVLMTQRGRIFIIFCIVFHQTKVDHYNSVCLNWQTDRHTHAHSCNCVWTVRQKLIYQTGGKSWSIRLGEQARPHLVSSGKSASMRKPQRYLSSTPL